MTDLFIQDKSKEISEMKEELQSYFKNRSSENIDRDGNLQRKLNLLSNLVAYQELRSDNPRQKKIREKINKQIVECQKFIDTPLEKFIKDFPSQCIQSSFELAVPNLVRKKHQMISRSQELKIIEEPDLLLEGFFIECTTRASSLMDKFDQLLPKMHVYIEIVRMLRNILDNMGRDASFWYFEEHNSAAIEMLGKDKIEYIRSALSIGPVSTEEIIRQFTEWVFYNRYAMVYFKELLPLEILDSLSSIGLPEIILSTGKKDYAFIASCICQCVLGKLEKKYFLGDNQGIVAISLSAYMPGLCLSYHEMGELYNYFLENQNIYPAFHKEFIKKNDKQKSNIKLGARNLLAVLIDFNWYGWFPEILIEENGPEIFPYEIKNCYAVIYNQYPGEREDIVRIFRGIINPTLMWSYPMLSFLDDGPTENTEAIPIGMIEEKI